jgi:stress-induced-phosphoprotein 1
MISPFLLGPLINNPVYEFSQAFEADSSNVAVLTNRAAVHFEQKDFDECIADCKLAIETGRTLRADFKVHFLQKW